MPFPHYFFCSFSSPISTGTFHFFSPLFSVSRHAIPHVIPSWVVCGTSLSFPFTVSYKFMVFFFTFHKITCLLLPFFRSPLSFPSYKISKSFPGEREGLIIRSFPHFSSFLLLPTTTTAFLSISLCFGLGFPSRSISLSSFPRVSVLYNFFIFSSLFQLVLYFLQCQRLFSVYILASGLVFPVFLFYFFFLLSTVLLLYCFTVYLFSYFPLTQYLTVIISSQEWLIIRSSFHNFIFYFTFCNSSGFSLHYLFCYDLSCPSHNPSPSSFPRSVCFIIHSFPQYFNFSFTSLYIFLPFVPNFPSYSTWPSSFPGGVCVIIRSFPQYFNFFFNFSRHFSLLRSKFSPHTIPRHHHFQGCVCP